MPFKKPHQISDGSGIIPPRDGSNKYVIEPRGLNIVWGNDTRYWKTTPQGAELIQVSWLEVSGKVPVDKGQRYSVKFHVHVKEDGFGWMGTEVLVMAKIGRRGRYYFKSVNLTPDSHLTIPPDPLEIEVKQDEADLQLHFGLYEVWSGKWKGGLVIKKAEVEKLQ